MVVRVDQTRDHRSLGETPFLRARSCMLESALAVANKGNTTVAYRHGLCPRTAGVHGDDVAANNLPIVLHGPALSSRFVQQTIEFQWPRQKSMLAHQLHGLTNC